MGRYFAAGGLIAFALTFVYAAVYSGVPDANLLPVYALDSFLRISVVFLASMAVGLAIGVLAASNKLAGKIVIPVFDILQSIPVLGYFPLLLVALIVAVPGIVGQELGVMVLLFTAMVWTVFFGVVGAVKAIPRSVEEAAAGFGLRGYTHFRNVVLPAVVPALVSASLLMWNDGWTFDIASEYISYGSRTYAVNGIGAYIERMSLSGTNLGAAWLGLLVMAEVVILSNQLILHPVTDRFGSGKSLGVSVPERVVHPLKAVGRTRRIFGLRFRTEFLFRIREKYSFPTALIVAAFLVILGSVAAVLLLPELFPSLAFIAATLEGQDLALIPVYTLFTLARMTAVYLACLLLSLVVALVVTQRRGATRYFYAIYDTGRAIPYLALFPPLFATLVGVMPGELGLEVSSFFLLFMGMIWYILFNIVTAANYLPTELQEVTSLFSVKGWTKIRNVLMPAIMPAIITGSILAWGGGWNVVIYSEYITHNGVVYSMPGLGSLLDSAATAGSSGLVFFYLIIMSGIVILLGRLVWRRLLNRVEKRGLELT